MIENTPLLDYKKPFCINPGLKQKFVNDYNYKSVKPHAIIKMKENKIISDRDIEICKFAFKVRFFTLNQLYRYFKSEGNKTNLKNRLEKLVKYRVLNKFTFVSLDGQREEQLGVFCLDLQGRFLLDNYSTLLTTDWNTSLNSQTPERVGEVLLSTEFYVRMLETCPAKLVSYEINPEFRCGDKTVIPNFRFTLNVGGEQYNFIGDITRDYSYPDTFAKKAERLESILTTNAWRKYYKTDTPPILLVFSNTDKNVRDAAEIIRSFTKMDLSKIRFSTDERIKEPLTEKGTFLRYEQKSVAELQYVLKKAQLSIFEA